MTWLRIFLHRLRGVFLKNRLERELDEEIRYHLEMQIEDNRRRGMSLEEARYLALRQFGGIEPMKEIYRERRSLPLLESTAQDLRYGARVLIKSPVFTVVAILTLALGIGANTAIFQLLDALRLRTLPVKNPQELAEVQIPDLTGARGNFNNWHASFTNPQWEQIRDRQEAFSGIFAWGVDDYNLTEGGEARGARAMLVSGDFFNVLGAQPLLGRLFSSEDDRRGCASPGVVISHSFWQRKYAGDPAVIGKQLLLEGHLFEIIGVTPASFFGLEVGRSFDVAVPICTEGLIHGEESRLDSGINWWLTVMGRLKPGWSLNQATAHLSSLAPAIFQATLPANYPPESVKQYLEFRLAAVPAGNGISELRENYESSLWLLLAIAGLVLLIACANLANLMLARAGAREKEMAVRLALGASRRRLIRQLLIESLLLATIGAICGILLSQVLSRFLVSFISTQGDQFFVALEPNWRILAFTAALAVLTCLLFGLAPAIRVTRADPSAVMKSGGRGLTAGRERSTLRRALVVAQVAISLVLLSGALLFTRSLQNLLTVDTGFRQDGILIAQVNLTRLKLPKERRLAFKAELLDRVRSLPGVQAAAEMLGVPLGGNSWSNSVWMDGADSGQRTGARFNQVSPNCFKTLETPLLAGRDFDERDTANSPKVAIVNEEFAQQLTGGANPVGQKFWVERTPRTPETSYEIVGLVKNTKYRELRETFSPTVFFPANQAARPSEYGQFLIRSNAPLNDLTAALTRAFGEVNPSILIDYQVFKTMIQGTLLRERLVATLSGFFSLLALLLAGVGLYGVLSYSVAGRRNEIGIRMALGAAARQVIWLILREALLLLFIGVAVGLPIVVVTTRFVAALLFGLTATDPLSLCLASLVLLAVSATAGYLPARRAARVDPMIALRYE